MDKKKFRIQPVWAIGKRHRRLCSAALSIRFSFLLLGRTALLEHLVYNLLQFLCV